MTTTTLENAVTLTGWNQNSQVGILLDYIDNQQSSAAFRDFLDQQLDSEGIEPIRSRDFEDYVAAANWSLDSQIEVLSRYIDNQDSHDCFADYIGERVDMEF